MIAISYRLNLSGLDKLKVDATTVFQGRNAAMRGVWKTVGAQVRDFLEERYKEASSPLSATWKPLSRITLLLRQRGSGPKIVDPEDLEARRWTVPKLVDTGRLRTSLTSGGPGSIFDVRASGVTVGTVVEHASVHQDGGSVTFTFDEAKQGRFAKNVLKVLPGRRPKPTLEQALRSIVRTPRRAKANWNPWYFIWWNWLKKMSGSTMEVPARPILVDLSPAQVADLQKTLDRGIERILQAPPGT